MELARELFLSAFIALALSFLVAKLVSAILAPENDADRASHPKTADNKKIVMEELSLRSAQGNQSDTRLESVEGEVAEVDRFQAHAPEEDLVEACDLREEPEVVNLSVKPSSSSEELEKSMSGKEDSLVAEEEWADRRDGGVDDQVESVTDDLAVPENSEIGGFRCEEENQNNRGDERIGEGNEEIGVARCEESRDGAKEKEVRVEGYEDDWEGIERSDLEKVFAAAANYVVSGDHSHQLADIGSDVEMELYGLYKIATEGPCRESQPMALRVSARANWNAWQRLGNMNPDVAMERYVALLSDKIPGWMKDYYDGDSKPDVLQEGITSTQDPKLSTLTHREPYCTNERKSETETAVEGDHLTQTSDLVEKVKE